ncbi:membrane protein YqaA with SNARE-associated domain [Kribbella amoyensis]|uniref:Membrane protein YqaA with SNARE-associated domain n=2 Tax=Kribbella amoyensis TaxID=996641 RepID=A0A561BMN8_9ACTN|nr:membrane protein YqaA with SNARE-associated domain [Kribbella amoyensis]
MIGPAHTLDVMWVWQLVLAVGFGIGSAVVPVLNAEAYILGAGVSGRLDPLAAAIGVSVGQTIGKLAMFLAVRYRPGYAARRTKEPKPVDLDTRWGRFVQWNRDLSKRLLDALSDRRWGIPVTLLSASVGIPPLYGVALIAGASRMSVVTFTLSVLAGRLARFVLLALGIGLF